MAVSVVSTSRNTLIMRHNGIIYEVPLSGDWVLKVKSIVAGKEHLVTDLKRIGLDVEWARVVRENK
jgi:hypothetical protein